MTQQASTQPVLACAQCGRTFGQSDLVPIAGNWVCGACKPAFSEPRRGGRRSDEFSVALRRVFGSASPRCSLTAFSCRS